MKDIKNITQSDIILKKNGFRDGINISSLEEGKWYRLINIPDYKKPEDIRYENVKCTHITEKFYVFQKVYTPEYFKLSFKYVNELSKVSDYLHVIQPFQENVVAPRTPPQKRPRLHFGNVEIIRRLQAPVLILDRTDLRVKRYGKLGVTHKSVLKSSMISRPFTIWYPSKLNKDNITSNLVTYIGKRRIPNVESDYEIVHVFKEIYPKGEYMYYGFTEEYIKRIENLSILFEGHITDIRRPHMRLLPKPPRRPNVEADEADEAPNFNFGKNKQKFNLKRLNMDLKKTLR
jgi:hypothetical protein